MLKRIILASIAAILISNFSFAWQYSIFSDNAPMHVYTDSLEQEFIVGSPYGGFWLSNNSGSTWTPINQLLSNKEVFYAQKIGVTGPNDSIVFCEFTVPSLSTIKVSRSSRWYWEELNVRDFWPENMGFEGHLGDLIVAPDNPNLWYTYTFNGFARSFDGGESWQVFSIPRYHNHYAFIDPLDSHTIFLTDAQRLLRSTNAGETFQAIASVSEPNCTDSWIHSVNRLQDNSLLIFIDLQIPHPETGQSTYFKRSFDNGETWEWVNMSGLPDYFYGLEIFVIDDQPGLLYAHSHYKTYLFRSSDYGVTWERVLGIVDRPHYSGIPYINSVSKKFYYPTKGYGLFVSDDFGYTWDRISSPEIGVQLGNNDCLKCSPEGLSLIDGSARFWSSDDNSINFQEEVYTSSPDTVVYVYSSDLDSADFRFRYISKYHYTEGGVSNYIYYSLDNGESWVANPFVLDNDSTVQADFFATRDSNGLTLFTLINGETKYSVSSDTGQTWETKELGFSQGFTQKLSDFLLIQDLQNRVLKVSHDLGDSWESIGYPPNAQWEFIPWALYHDSTMFFRASDHCWARLPDGSWEERGEIFAEDVDHHLPVEFFWDLVTSPSDTFLVAGSKMTPGLYVSDDWGWTWERNDLGMTWANQGRTINKVVYDKYRDRLWIDTGAGLAYLNGPSTSVEGASELISATYDTLHAYPNPFNNSTKITFALDQPGKVSVQVYDILGRKVADLYDDYATIGSHTVLFDGDGLATGSYFVHFIQDGNTTTRKISLIK